MGLIDRLKQLEVFITPAGTAELIGAVQTYRRAYGEKWLVEFRTNNPGLCDLVELAANYDFPEAWDKLISQVDEWIDGEPSLIKRIGLHAAKGAALDGAKPDVEKLHAALKAEIDRPRF